MSEPVATMSQEDKDRSLNVLALLRIAMEHEQPSEVRNELAAAILDEVTGEELVYMLWRSVQFIELTINQTRQLMFKMTRPELHEHVPTGIQVLDQLVADIVAMPLPEETHDDSD